MNLGEKGREGQTTVSGEGVAHAAASSHDCRGSEQHAHQGEASENVSDVDETSN